MGKKSFKSRRSSPRRSSSPPRPSHTRTSNHKPSQSTPPKTPPRNVSAPVPPPPTTGLLKIAGAAFLGSLLGSQLARATTKQEQVHIVQEIETPERCIPSYQLLLECVESTEVENCNEQFDVFSRCYYDNQ